MSPVVVPHAAVSACVLRGETILLVKRGKPPFAGAWSLPGGSIEAGETSEAAIRREIAEETGLCLDIRGVAGVNDVIVRDTSGDLRHHYTIIVFAGIVFAGTDAVDAGALRDPVAASDAADARFFALDSPEVSGLGHRVVGLIFRAARMIAEDRASL